MKRYQDLVNSGCLGCNEWLCVTAGAYTGEIVCPKCGIVNIFEDSLQPRTYRPVTASPLSHRDNVCVK